MNNKEFTISIFDRFYYRSKKRLYDLFETDENPFLEWVLTVTSIFAYFLGVGVMPTPMFEKYKPDMGLLESWITSRFAQEYVDSDEVRFYRNSVIGLFDEFKTEEYNLRGILDKCYLRDETALMGMILTKYLMPKEYLDNYMEYEMESLAEFSDFMRTENHFDLYDKFEKTLLDCMNEMGRIAHTAWTEYIDDED